MQKSLSLIIIVILISCEKQFVRYPTSSIVKSSERTGKKQKTYILFVVLVARIISVKNVF